MSSKRRFFAKGFLAPLFAVAALAGTAAPQQAQAAVAVVPHIIYPSPPMDARAEETLEKMLENPATPRADLARYTQPQAYTALHEGGLRYEDVCREKGKASGHTGSGDLINCMEDRYEIRIMANTAEGAAGIAGLLLIGGFIRRRMPA